MNTPPSGGVSSVQSCVKIKYRPARRGVAEKKRKKVEERKITETE